MVNRDENMVVRALMEVLRADLRPQSEIADESGMDRSTLNKVFLGKRTLSLIDCDLLLRHYGMQITQPTKRISSVQGDLVHSLPTRVSRRQKVPV